MTMMRSLLLVLAALFTLGSVVACGDPEPIDPAEEFGDQEADDGFDMGDDQPGMDPADEPEMEWDDDADFDDFDDDY